MTEAIVAGAFAGAMAGAIAGLIVAYVMRPRPANRWRSSTSRQQAEYVAGLQHIHGSTVFPRSADVSHATGPAAVGIGPFDRFDDGTKRVLALAQDEAIRFNHNYIGTEHLLLGLMREGDGVAAQVLHALGGDLAVLRRQVEMTIGRGDAAPSEITLSPRTKRTIEFAIDEARKLGHAHVGTEHLLLGVIRDTGSMATGVLETVGLKPDAIRERVIAMVGQPSRPPSQAPLFPNAGGSPFSRFDEGAKRVLALSQDEAIRLNHNYIGTEHLLLGLLRHVDGVAARVLVANGVVLDKARTAVSFIVPTGDAVTSPSEITLSPRTKKVIELSADEAMKLGAAAVSSGHVLLGLVREGEGIACGVIESLGVPLEKIRQDVLRAISPER